jgi:uncharacterized repeat protein (TIGR01451 family)
MTRHYLFACVLVAALGPAAALGQAPPPEPPALLFVRFGGEPGLRVTFYEGTPVGKEYDAPVAAGLRPGYVYRVQLTGLPGHPEVALYPTLEVLGTLQSGLRFRAADYPAPIVLNQEDVERVLAGALLTKVVYLEHPDRAVPTASRLDQPVELEAPPGTDPLAEARAYGRPVLILRVGERQVSPEELAYQSVPGTILLPGEKCLPPAACPPWFPGTGFPAYDPRVGPRLPEEELLRDGGDAWPRAGLDQAGKLGGLDPADTVGEYIDGRGRARVAVSNPVCICVARYVIMRGLTPLASHNVVVGLGKAQAVQGRGLLQARVPSLHTGQHLQPEGMQSRRKPSENAVTTGMLALRQIRGPVIVGQIVDGPRVVTQAQQPADVTAVCYQGCCIPDQPLGLCKWTDTHTAQVGDVLTFYIKYTNHGGQPIKDVAVSDSLTGRLEYVPGSNRSDRTATFTTQANEAGSLILRWEIAGELPPGKSGLVSFQARVR